MSRLPQSISLLPTVVTLLFEFIFGQQQQDYVKCLAYAKDRDLVASAGFDKCIFLWDANVCRMLSTPKMTNINENKYSIYSIALNNQGTLLAAGSPENCIRLWDPRTTNKVMKLKGHTHNIRNLIFNKDGTQLLSASSDHTIRIWSLAQQMCIAKFEIHTEGVWTVCVNDTFTKCISAGKDLKIFMTDLRDPDLSSLLVCEEKAPILSVCFICTTPFFSIVLDLI
jgi:WD repeat-containing protein 48